MEIPCLAVFFLVNQIWLKIDVTINNGELVTLVTWTWTIAGDINGWPLNTFQTSGLQCLDYQILKA